MNWLDKLEETSSYLSELSITDVQKTIRRVVEQTTVDVEKTINSLANYRFVDEIKDLHLGKHIRWIRIDSDTKLTNGGMVIKLSFLAKGTYIYCKNDYCKNGRTIMQYNFDDCYTFQKLSAEEHLILMANDICK